MVPVHGPGVVHASRRIEQADRARVSDIWGQRIITPQQCSGCSVHRPGWKSVRDAPSGTDGPRSVQCTRADASGGQTEPVWATFGDCGSLHLGNVRGAVCIVRINRNLLEEASVRYTSKNPSQWDSHSRISPFFESTFRSHHIRVNGVLGINGVLTIAYPIRKSSPILNLWKHYPIARFVSVVHYCRIYDCVVESVKVVTEAVTVVYGRQNSVCSSPSCVYSIVAPCR
ncbi:hypothetical protein ACLOJK_037128 [Asimina triloba]